MSILKIRCPKEGQFTKVGANLVAVLPIVCTCLTNTEHPDLPVTHKDKDPDFIYDRDRKRNRLCFHSPRRTKQDQSKNFQLGSLALLGRRTTTTTAAFTGGLVASVSGSSFISKLP